MKDRCGHPMFIEIPIASFDTSFISASAYHPHNNASWRTIQRVLSRSRIFPLFYNSLKILVQRRHLMSKSVRK